MHRSQRKDGEAGQRRMKAAVYRRYGPPEVLQIEDVEKPVPNDSQVLIRIHATTVSAADWRMRRAVPFIVRFMTGFWRPKKIQILGMEFSGTVESVGQGRDALRRGRSRYLDRPGSSSARMPSTYACLRMRYWRSSRSTCRLRKPRRSCLAECRRCISCRKSKQSKAGQKVLIYGASGSVGSHSRFNWRSTSGRTSQGYAAPPTWTS